MKKTPKQTQRDILCEKDEIYLQFIIERNEIESLNPFKQRMVIIYERRG